MIKINTLTKKDASYIKFDKNGNIDLKLLNSHNSESGNFNSLKTLANSQFNIDVSIGHVDSYIDKNGNKQSPNMSYQPAGTSTPDPEGNTLDGTSTGEAGHMGQILLPGKDGLQNSPDGHIKVIINSMLSESAKAEIYSHEANGHVFIYVTTLDKFKARHMYKGTTDTNKVLDIRIINSKKETIKNIKTQ